MLTRSKKHSRPFTKLIAMLTTATVSTLLFAGIASAHVTVAPAVSKPGAWETYTMKVPVEKEIPTNKIALKVPDNVDFKQYEPIPGWKVAMERNAAGKVDTVTWTAEGDGIEAGQYQRFSFVAVNPAGDANVTWNAFQYYADGSIVEWTGGEGSQRPHSITRVTADENAEADTGHSHNTADGHHSDGDLGGDTTGSTDSTKASKETGAANSAASTDNATAKHDEEQASTSAQAGTSTGQTASGTESAASAMNTGTTVMSIAGLIISLAALTLAIRNRQRR